jgi:sugar O-acyltransferase (sialic acid O-acetyltransferase NeuD family)
VNGYPRAEGTHDLYGTFQTTIISAKKDDRADFQQQSWCLTEAASVAERLVIVGAGGLAREVVWLAREISGVSGGPVYDCVGFVVSDLAKPGRDDSVDQVLGDIGWLDRNRDQVDALAIGIGNPAVRRRIGAELSRRFPQIAWPALIHPSVICDRETCRFGRGTIVCAGTIATANVVVDDFALVNLACTLGHECRIGAGSVLNPTVNISGGVVIGPGVLVGTGAQVLQYLKVGEAATVGAGAVVTKDVPAGQTVVGIPAKPLATDRE